jgi:Flp pilus assembly protein TadB
VVEMQDPDQVRVPDVVPATWVASYRDERTERHALMVSELERLDRASRHDTSLLLAASWLCLLLLAVTLGWIGTNASSARMWVAVSVVLSTFATCLWFVHRGRRCGRP